MSLHVPKSLEQLYRYAGRALVTAALVLNLEACGPDTNQDHTNQGQAPTTTEQVDPTQDTTKNPSTKNPTAQSSTKKQKLEGKVEEEELNFDEAFTAEDREKSAQEAAQAQREAKEVEFAFGSNK